MPISSGTVCSTQWKWLQDFWLDLVFRSLSGTVFRRKRTCIIKKEKIPGALLEFSIGVSKYIVIPKKV
jgi:hypothetical protein